METKMDHLLMLAAEESSAVEALRTGFDPAIFLPAALVAIGTASAITVVRLSTGMSVSVALDHFEKLGVSASTARALVLACARIEGFSN